MALESTNVDDQFLIIFFVVEVVNSAIWRRWAVDGLTQMAELDPHIHFFPMKSPESVGPEGVVSLLQVS